jgi:hypothetical protein
MVMNRSRGMVRLMIFDWPDALIRGTACGASVKTRSASPATAMLARLSPLGAAR